MPRFAANLTMLFQEVPFPERFACAQNAGFEFVEYLFPYAWQAQNLKEWLDQNGLRQVLFNLPPGNWDKGERGIACHPDRRSEFRDGVEQAIEYAQILEVPQINCLAGLQPGNISENRLRDTLLDNLAYAAQQCATHQLDLLIEPINSRVDMPGFYLDTLDKALQVQDTLQCANLKIQFDIYHMQIMHGDLSRRLSQYLDRIGHIQFADNPGRHEPGTGEINFVTLFSLLDDIGYQGWVSAEYIPEKDSEASLSWLQTFN